ncbi:aldolase/citrate lyase family protein [Myxococcota bacterium]|nr:aldolase/citrate lyase family protein [Myxococcota bacterium]
MALHPKDALYEHERPFPILAGCEHYAGSERLVKKALELQAARGGGFDVTIDLEDGAPAGREPEHAALAVELLRSPANALGRVGVRIHAHAEDHWRHDVDTVLRGAGDRVAYLTVPKVKSAAEVADVAAYVAAVAHHAGVRRAPPLHVLVETHGALRDVWAIAALPMVEVLDFGLMDFISDHHGAIPDDAMRSPGQFEHALLRRAKSELVAAALANGVVPAHNVTLDLKSREQTHADAKRARLELGFLRMWSIHPEQIEPIIDAMRPDVSAAERAGAILLRARARDFGPLEHEGRLHDRASYRYYWELLQRARLAGTKLPEEVEAAFFT